MKKWFLFTITIGFATYWLSNLILWFPWSYSTTLGITLMMTLAPILWAYSTFLTLRTYPNSNLFKGTLIVSLSFLSLAVVLDYIFFGIIRNAMEELYHPTTFYGYGFLIFWPFVLALIFRNKNLSYKRIVKVSDFYKAILTGIISFGVLSLIIILE